MSTLCDSPEQKVVTFTIGVVLKPEGGLLPRYFKRGTQVCLKEEVTQFEDCNCPNLPTDQRIKEVVYYRFLFNEKSWLVSSSNASTGVPPGMNRTEDELRERIANVGDVGLNPNVRNDAAIRENWGKLVM